MVIAPGEIACILYLWYDICQASPLGAGVANESKGP